MVKPIKTCRTKSYFIALFNNKNGKQISLKSNFSEYSFYIKPKYWNDFVEVVNGFDAKLQGDKNVTTKNKTDKDKSRELYKRKLDSRLGIS